MSLAGPIAGAKTANTRCQTDKKKAAGTTPPPAPSRPVTVFRS